MILKEKSDYYVYLMFKPWDGSKPFYIGKGKGKRAVHHMKQSEDWYNSRKASVMRQIRDKNLEPNIVCLPMPTEKEALEYEKFLIKHFGRKHIDEGGCLTNLALDANPPSRKGKPGTFKGKKHTEETKEKIREGLKRNRSKLTKEQLSAKYNSTKNSRRKNSNGR